ncbi:SDR family NAD(P)-dependent oxidoreductase [Salinisphaera sp. LB1]|uniref:SDR family NAD(P)-dependent oxidoreductase n=1 Tax=Salinisphaera sp. LB1 TaxID=2183911 RepID=UPI000D7086E9|nr:SDR family NAD(P)-dependent oxidoreductase [Salinisphaera sp. LB1]AWN16883.1 3-oxoacyl-[acyl-carrier protein] reductase [Salinisphaera sp. LB1]
MNRFDQRIAMITGAASGIGRACARRLAAEGASVIALDRNESALADLSADLPGDDGHVLRAVDIRDDRAVAACIDDIVARYGRIDVLCNNAGIAGTDHSPIYDNDHQNWRDIVDVNLLGSAHVLQTVAGAMRAAGRGAIVNTASVAGLRSGAGGNAYSATKAGVISLTQTAACDLGEYGIRVNAVCPGLIETGITRPVFEYAAAHGKTHKLGARCELRRYGHPEEVAAVIAFLASDDASFVTGQALAVDGGNTASLNMPGMKF